MDSTHDLSPFSIVLACTISYEFNVLMLWFAGSHTMPNLSFIVRSVYFVEPRNLISNSLSLLLTTWVYV